MPQSPSMTIADAAQLPSKPPKRAWLCTVEAHADAGSWLLLTDPLETVLASRLPVSTATLRLNSAGQTFIKFSGDVAVSAFRIPPGGFLRIPGWEFWTFGGATGGEAVLVSDLRFNDGRTLTDLAGGPLAPPAHLPSTPSVLAQWTAPADFFATVDAARQMPFQLPAHED